MQHIKHELLAKVLGGAGPQKKCDSKGPTPPLPGKDPKSIWNNSPGIIPTMGGPSIMHPIIPCRATPQVDPPRLDSPSLGPSTSMTA